MAASPFVTRRNLTWSLAVSPPPMFAELFQVAFERELMGTTIWICWRRPAAGRGHTIRNGDPRSRCLATNI
jgi:hypothetical protein